MNTALSPDSGNAAARYPFSIIRERIRERGDVVDFAIGRHQLAPPPAVIELVRDRPELALRRRQRSELDDLVDRAVAMLAREYGVRVAPECVLPGPGGRTTISALAAALIRPGDPVLVTEPGYPAFARVATQHGAQMASAALDPARAFAPDLGGLGVELATIRLAALNYPNNPSGAAVTPGLAETIGGAIAPGAVVFNDAAYGPLVYDGAPRSMLAADGGGVVVELHSLTKLFGTGPLGLSLLVGPPAVIESVRAYGEFVWTPPSSLQTRVAACCVDDAAHLDEARRFFGARVTRLREVLATLGFDPWPTPSGLYVLCPVPAAVRSRAVKGAWEAADALLDEAGIAVMPWDGPNGGSLRFSALHGPDDLEALARTADAGKLVFGRLASTDPPGRPLETA